MQNKNAGKTVDNAAPSHSNHFGKNANQHVGKAHVQTFLTPDGSAGANVAAHNRSTLAHFHQQGGAHAHDHADVRSMPHLKGSRGA